MGNKLTLLSKNDEKAVQNKIRAYGEDFLARFSQAYKECLVYSYIDKENRINASSSSSSSSSSSTSLSSIASVSFSPPNDLLSAAKPVTVLCSGSMLKRRGPRGRWRQYYFEARNKADNYDIFYYVESNNGELTFKDRLDCYSYHLESLSYDETSANGELALKLISYDSNLPEHWFLPQSSNEHRAWESAMTIACQRAAPPQPEDPLIIKAFTKTMCRMRCSVGIFDVFVMKASIHDTMESFLEGIMQRQPTALSSTLNELVMNEQDVNIREESISSILDSVNMMVKQVVSDIWSRCLLDVDNTNLALKGRIEYSLYDIMAAEKAIHSSIIEYYTSESVQNMVNASLKSDAYRPVLEMSVDAINEAFQEAASAFHNDILSSLENARISLTSLGNSNSNSHSSLHSNDQGNGSKSDSYGGSIDEEGKKSSTIDTDVENVNSISIPSKRLTSIDEITTQFETNDLGNVGNVNQQEKENPQEVKKEEEKKKGESSENNPRQELIVGVGEDDHNQNSNNNHDNNDNDNDNNINDYTRDDDNRKSDHIFTEAAISEVVKDISTQLDRPPSQITLIGDAQMILWNWYTDVLADHADILPDSNVVFELHSDVLEILTDLIRNAIFTFTVLVTNGGAEHHTYNSLQRTLERLQVDMQKHQKMISLRLLAFLTDAEINHRVLSHWWSNDMVHQAITDAHLTGSASPTANYYKGKSNNHSENVDKNHNKNGNDDDDNGIYSYWTPLQNTIDDGGMQSVTKIDKSIIDLVSVREIGEREIKHMASISLTNLLESVLAKNK